MGIAVTGRYGCRCAPSRILCLPVFACAGTCALIRALTDALVAMWSEVFHPRVCCIAAPSARPGLLREGRGCFFVAPGCDGTEYQ